MRITISRLASLKLTITCLTLLMALVVGCTLAQVHLGIYAAVETYIRSFFVYASLPGTPWKFPVFPGGGLVGIVLLVNLMAAQYLRLQVIWRKAGLWLIHLGLILLFVGEFATSFFAVETNMAIEEGASKNYAESFRDTELAAIDTTDPEVDRVVSIPQALFSRKKIIKHPGLPFNLAIKRYWPNASLKMGRGSEDGGGPAATQGIGAGISVIEAPVTTRDDEQNNVTALVEVLADGNSLGTWLVSSALGAPQVFLHQGRTWRLAIRMRRYYLPYTVTLKDFKHDVYPGTDIPKNFSSLVRLQDKEKGEDRDVLIYMNHPLRYRGKTFYQASFGKDDTLSVFQVVENPGWLLPYFSCVLVALGLLLHFVVQMRGSKAVR